MSKEGHIIYTHDSPRSPTRRKGEVEVVGFEMLGGEKAVRFLVVESSGPSELKRHASITLSRTEAWKMLGCLTEFLEKQ